MEAHLPQSVAPITGMQNMHAQNREYVLMYLLSVACLLLKQYSSAASVMNRFFYCKS